MRKNSGIALGFLTIFESGDDYIGRSRLLLLSFGFIDINPPNHRPLEKT